MGRITARFLINLYVNEKKHIFDNRFQNLVKMTSTDLNETQPIIETVNPDASKPKCFVIMPLGDVLPYESDHFNLVFTEIIQPACDMAGFIAETAAVSRQSHKIMTHILRSIVNFDMALCDLSSANANVFYELGIRQMAKMPVAIIKDDITDDKFDIRGFRYQNYHHSLRSDRVKKDIENISGAIRETYENRDAITSEFLDDLSVDVQIDPKKLAVSKGEALLSQKMDLLLSRIGNTDPDKSRLLPQHLTDVLGSPLGVGDFYSYSFIRGGNVPKNPDDNIHLITAINIKDDNMISVAAKEAFSGISTRVAWRIRSGELGYKKLDPSWVKLTYPEQYEAIVKKSGLSLPI